ncbi:MAG: extracellular solute-binding protein [Candidatus Paracaedibacteraceae bacterium]|nr:extracellular solute-binding protein [Candidatus Paracaedibacteraceae bacterium]
MKTLSRIIISIFFISLFFYIFPNKKKYEDAIVNIYDWYGMIPAEVLQEFEKETGIRVRYDVYDNNEVLEAKLLASNSGYDVVFPTASPYVARQIKVGIYQPLNKQLLSELNGLNKEIVEQMQSIDPGLMYAVPYYWGTLGIAYDKDKLKERLPNVDLESNEILFNPENLKKLKSCGVSFLEEAIDVVPLVQAYLGSSSDSENDEDLKKASDHLQKLRPFIRRFTSSRFINDLVLGDVCVAQAWSGDAQQAEIDAKELKRNIAYIIPKEGTTLWIDCMAIPVGSPHPINAHKFINFLLRPEISAKITNKTKLPTTIDAAFPMIEKAIQKNKSIYPNKEVMKKLHLNKPQTSHESLKFDRERTKAWINIRLNKK